MFTDPKPGALRVALVGCGASKLDRPAPARELYTSNLFHLSIKYAEKTCDQVFIVSALHGVVEPEQVFEPYNWDLRKLGKREREDWGVRTIGGVYPSPKFDVPPRLVIVAGKLYAEALLYGAHWHNLPRPEEPLRGIRGCGPRMAWLKANTP